MVAGSVTRAFFGLAVTMVLAPWLLVLAVRPVHADSPLDGIYRITETFPTGQSITAPACWATPMRKALATDPSDVKTSFYDVQITMANNKVAFSAPGSNVALFTAPVVAEPTVAGQLPAYKVQDTKHATNAQSGLDYWYIDGEFIVHPVSNIADVDIKFQYQDSPDHTGLCATEINGTMTTRQAGSTGGVPIDITTALVGGVVIVTTITVGGWRWRNRQKKPLTPPGNRLAGKVPARCNDLAVQHDTQLEILNSLNEAVKELGEKLEKAETIHRNNIIKARMVFNLQIIQTVGGFVTDFALALRPGALRAAGAAWMGESDTWRPPGSISSELSERISQANELWRNLLGKFHQLGNQIEMLKGTVQEAVENLPAVKEAKTVLEIQMNRLGEMMQDLSIAQGIRTQIRELDSEITTARAATDATETAWREAQGELSKANSSILQARNQLPDAFHNAENRLNMAKKQVLELQMSGVEDTAKLSAVTGKAENAMAAAEQASGKQLAKIADLTKAAEEKQALVAKVWAEHEAAGKAYDKLADQQTVLDNTLASQYGDLKPSDIEAQGKIAGQAEKNVDLATAQGTAQVGRELVEKEAERERTASEAYAAHELLNDLRAQSERSDTWNKRVGAGLGKVVKVVLTPITYPAGLLMEGWEYVFGSGQSPQEIVDILVRGQTNVKILRTYVSELDKRIFTQEQLVERLKAQVEACVAGTTVTKPTTKPSQPTQPTPPPPPTPTPPQQPVVTQ